MCGRISLVLVISFMYKNQYNISTQTLTDILPHGKVKADFFHTARRNYYENNSHL